MGLRSALARRLDFPLRLFLKRSAVVAIIRVGGLLSVFALQILLARLIGNSEEYGKYAWGQSLLFMAGSIAAMGIPIVTGRFIASLSAQQNERAVVAVTRRAREILARASGLLLLMSLGLALLGRVVLEGNFYLSFAALSLCLAPGVSLLLLYQQMCRARHWLILAFLPMQVLRPIATAGMALALWWVSGNNLSGYQVLLLVGASTFIVGIPQAVQYHVRQKRLLSATDNTPDPGSADHTAELSRTTLPMLVNRIAALTRAYSNVLLVGSLSGPAAAGAYFAAERLAQLCSTPPSIVSSVIQPDIAAAYAREDTHLLRELTRRTLHSGLWPTAAIALLLVILAGPILALFGDDFSRAEPVLAILVAGLVIQTALGPAEELLLMTGKQDILPRVMVCTAIFHLLLLCVLVPTLGAVGAALTTAASGILSSGWQMSLVRRELSFDPTIFSRAKSNER